MLKIVVVVVLHEGVVIIVGANAGAKQGANASTLFLRVVASRLFPNGKSITECNAN